MNQDFKISVSNIAWPAEADEVVSEILRDFGIDSVEIALTRYFPDTKQVDMKDVKNLRCSWERFGCSISSLQSLLFNQPSLQLFGSSESKSDLENLLLKFSEIAFLLDVKPMVFGAPKNRLRQSLSIGRALKDSENFFKTLSEKWPHCENFLAIEANPEAYGCDFLTKSSDSLEFVKNLNVACVKWHLDIACTELGGESTIELLNKAELMPSHIHLSEGYLRPLVWDKLNFYKSIFKALRERNYQGFITLEMREPPHVQDLVDSIQIMVEAAKA